MTTYRAARIYGGPYDGQEIPISQEDYPASWPEVLTVRGFLGEANYVAGIPLPPIEEGVDVILGRLYTFDQDVYLVPRSLIE